MSFLELGLMSPSFQCQATYTHEPGTKAYRAGPKKRTDPKATQMQAGSIKSPGKRVAVTSNQTGGQRKLLFVQRADRMLTAGIYMAPYSITSRLPRIPTSAAQ